MTSSQYRIDPLADLKACIIMGPDKWYKTKNTLFLDQYNLIAKFEKHTEFTLLPNENLGAHVKCDGGTVNFEIPPMNGEEMMNLCLYWRNKFHSKETPQSTSQTPNKKQLLSKRTPGRHDDDAMMDSPMMSPAKHVDNADIPSSRLNFDSTKKPHFKLQTQSIEMNALKQKNLLVTLIKEASQQREGKDFIHHFASEEYPEYDTIVHNPICLTMMHNKASSSPGYVTIQDFLHDLNLLVSNAELYFGRNGSPQWKFILRRAYFLKAFILFHLEKELALMGTSDVVLSETLQKQIHRLGGSYAISHESQLYNSADPMKSMIRAHPKSEYALPIRIDSFLRAFYEPCKMGRTFSNQTYDLPHMSIVSDATRFVNEDCACMVPLFYCEETSSLVLTYKWHSSADFPVYIMDFHADDQSHQDGPIPISKFLELTKMD